MEENTTGFYLKMNANNSLDDTKPEVKTQLALYDILIPSLGLFIILLNLAVVISSGLILKKGQQPRSTYLFLGNVAMADLITGFAVVFGQLYPKANRDHHICAIQLGMIVASTLASVYSVGLIAIDRFLYILHGLQYQQYIYPTRARLLILLAWIIGCVVGFLPLFGWYGDTNNGKYCWFIRLAPKNLIILTVIAGVVPLILVLVLYSIILYHAIKKIIQLQKSSRRTDNLQEGADTSRNLRMFRGGNNSLQVPSTSSTNGTPDDDYRKTNGLMSRIFRRKPSETVQGPTKWRAIKVVLYTTSSFTITWSPYFITSLYYVYECENNDSKKCKSLSVVIASPLAILGFCNSLLNPIIYAWWHKGFREYVHKRVSVVIMKARRLSNAVMAHNINGSYNVTNSNNSIKSVSRKQSTTSTSDPKSNISIPEIFIVEEANENPR